VSDIFSEVDAELRQDRMRAFWESYRAFIIGGALFIVVAVSAVTGVQAYTNYQNEAASARYDALQDEIGALDDSAVKIDRLNAFAAAENNGYGILAAFAASVELAVQGQGEAALAGFDALTGNGGVPDSMRDYARLQAATILLDNNGAIDEIAARLTPILANDNALRATARDILALAYVLADDPLQARLLYQEQLADETATRLARQRAQIMLGEVELILAPGANGANAAESAGQ
jgi:hypothetical protein